MTQGIYRFPQEQLSFQSDSGKVLPCEIEAEETIIGGILDDPNAIYRIKNRLKPEHFYISAHKDIYQACLRLCNKGKPNDLLSVTSLLRDHGILAKIGGQNKLASVMKWNVSTVNIDHMADLVIQSSVLRQVIKLGGEITSLGYETQRELPDLLAEITERTRSIVETPIAPTRDEHEQWLHDRLLDELTTIYTTCSQPSLRLLKLKRLADDHRLSMGFLEHFYLKTLIAQCTKLLTYEELKELAGSTVREWLLNGLIPQSTTILLASDGGVGKTKFAYAIGKILIQGTQFGPFVTTGKRKILYYQGDESPGDMLQALDSLGYSEQDIGESVRVRFGWSAENMPTLIQDLKEFQPELVFIDSLSTANRFSIYRESEMEYARPILEMTGLATQYKTTFVIIHHTNKEGGVRGTTAIRNAVSEVWTLTKDNKETATPYDRILEIDKSRSRSSSKKYRMYFNPDDLSFTFLGEEGDELGGPGQSAKESTLQLLADNRNIKFTSEEIAHRLGLSKAYARRYLGELSADGMVSVKRQPGKANAYFLAFKEGSPKDHPSDHLTSHSQSVDRNELQPNPEFGIKNTGSPQDHPSDHLLNADTVSNTDACDPQTDENSDQTLDSEILIAPSHIEDHLRSNALPDNSSVGDPGGDPTPILCENIHSLQIETKPLPGNDSDSFRQGDPGGDPGVILTSDHHPTPSMTKPELPLLPLLEEKGVYWSLSFKREVKIFQIFDEFSEASCQVQGRGRFSLTFTDLQCLSQSPRSDLSVGDKVVILVGKHKETFATITTIRADGIWLKCDDRKKLLARAYFPHQLVKV
ncbi:DnaB-like helicase N-terminal domain-containing protein [Nostoc sp. PA-18-2419]|uniref:DnaB-like helicase N-terminal domain-containing protein n=1 Tax=Nostoc sp. PA-18-2419 TaxID=2575443 RepID=UPI001109B5BB|nr:DnaB-like helicase N-terminal domain-containing protein [Nostoc sp. PA-18-2419]